MCEPNTALTLLHLFYNFSFFFRLHAASDPKKHILKITYFICNHIYIYKGKKKKAVIESTPGRRPTQSVTTTGNEKISFKAHEGSPDTSNTWAPTHVRWVVMMHFILLHLHSRDAAYWEVWASVRLFLETHMSLLSVVILQVFGFYSPDTQSLQRAHVN